MLESIIVNMFVVLVFLFLLWSINYNTKIARRNIPSQIFTGFVAKGVNNNLEIGDRAHR